jgi:hypothetical protein
MRSYLRFLSGWCLAATIFACHKDNDLGPAPSPAAPVISNLQFTPNTVTIKPWEATFIVGGTFNFTQANGGVASIRLTANAGINLTVPVPDNALTEGMLQGIFEFTMPSAPTTINFEVWLVDKKGNASNKLSGTIQVVVDDSGQSWLTISQQWPLDKVAWIDNQFMAVGQNGDILTSPNGKNWTPRTSGVSTSLFGIARSSNKWVVAGSFGTILTSPDGVTWSRQLDIPNNIHFMGVAWSGSRWVAVGEQVPETRPAIFTSTDAVVWNRVNLPANLWGKLNAVTWANNKFVAVGKNFSPFVISSADGINWGNQASTNEMQGELVDIVWNGSQYAAVGFEVAATSTDGINWNFAKASNLGLTGLAWSGKHYIAVGITGIYKSTDGLSWIRLNDSPYIPRSVAWSGYAYVTVGFISPILMLSPM